MRLTIVNLKSNRNEIIEILTKEVGSKNLKSAMNMMIQSAELEEQINENRTIDEEIQVVTSGDYFQNRKMKTADYVAGLNGHSSNTFAFNHTSKI